MKLEIINGHLVDPKNEIDQLANIYIADEKIIAVGKQPADWHADQSIDAKNKLVLPGLVELSASLREPGHEHKATVRSETHAASAAGITSLACLPTTDPVIDSPAQVELIEQLSHNTGLCHVYVIGALTTGLNGENLSEMAALKAAGCVGVSNVFHPMKSSLVLRRAMEYASSQDLTVFSYPLVHALANNGCVHEGITSSRLGLPGIPAAAETAAVAFQIALIEELNVRTHFCRISTQRAVTMISRTRYDNFPITADTSILHLYLSDQEIHGFDGLCHNQPPFRTVKDREGLRTGIKDGTLSAICADHQPHEIEAKLAPFQSTEPGSSTLETLLPLTLELVKENVLSLSEAVNLITQQPADILGIPAGNLCVGAIADACIVDLKQSWILNSENMYSRGKNTPLLGDQLNGRVTHTILNGKVVYENTLQN
jgi:dihydroorotase